MPRFRIHHQVADEFEEVLAWYASLSPLAADNFILCFENGLNKVRLHPTAQALWRPPFRRVRLARFPYLLIFSHQPTDDLGPCAGARATGTATDLCHAGEEAG